MPLRKQPKRKTAYPPIAATTPAKDHPPLTVVRGLPGSGKSRHLIEWVNRARAAGHLVSTFACSESAWMRARDILRLQRLLSCRKVGLTCPLDHFVSTSECVDILGRTPPGTLVAFEEAQYFGPEIVAAWLAAAGRGLEVLVVMPSLRQLELLRGCQYADKHLAMNCQLCQRAEATSPVVVPGEDATLSLCMACNQEMTSKARREIVERLQKQAPYPGEQVIYQPVELEECAGWRVLRPDSKSRADLMARIVGKAGLPGNRSPGDATYLDIGCNTGYFCHRMSQLGFFAKGIDIVKEDIAVAQLLNSHIRREYNVYVMADAWDFLRDTQDQCFDVTSAFAVFQWLMIQTSIERGLACLQWLAAKTSRLCFLEMGYSAEAHYQGTLPVQIDRAWVHDLMAKNGGFDAIEVFDAKEHGLMRDLFVGWKEPRRKTDSEIGGCQPTHSILSGTATTVSGMPQSANDDPLYYQRLRGFVLAHVPPAASVLVVSKGDDTLLALDDRRAGHFPQTATGVYAGYHPSDSAEAIAGLESLRERGADYLFLPYTSAWWLEHYAEFAQHLDQRYKRVAEAKDTGILFDLRRLLATSVQVEQESEPTEPRSDTEQAKWKDYYGALPLAEEDEATKGFNQQWVHQVSEFLSTGGQVLEAGCGAGWQSLALARTGQYRVSLMDFTPAALAYARRLFVREGLTADFIEGDAFQPGAPEYDLVFNAGVLEHYAFDQQVELVRAMASRSRRYVAVLVPNRLCYWYWLWRIQKAGAGRWPFGKEVPRLDLSSLYQAAGLRLLGQAFLGQTWTEGLIHGTDGLDPAFRDLVLQVHRSSVIPAMHKAYLVAALGSVTEEKPPALRLWTMPVVTEQPQWTEAAAVVADALALRIGAEGKLRQLQDQLTGYQQQLPHQASLTLQTKQEAARRERGLRVELKCQARAAKQSAAEALQRNAELVAAQAQLAQLTFAAHQAGEMASRGERDQQGQLAEQSELAARAEQEALRYRAEGEDLRRRLAESDAEHKAAERKQEWLQAALASERHARQVLEAAVSTNYPDAIARVRDVVRATIPRGATVLVVSRGDPELLKFDGRQGWHFPRGQDGGYAGYYPADSAAAIQHLQSLIAQGAQFLLLPHTAFWWLEHYRGLEAYLDRIHVGVWRDERCAVYRLTQISTTEAIAPQPSGTANHTLDQSAGTPPSPLASALPENVPPMISALTNHYDVVCFPIINWDFRFQRPQQLMSRFAAAGHRVFYLSHRFCESDESYVVCQVAPNLYEVSLRGLRINAYQGVLHDDARERLFASLDALRRDYSLGATVSLVQLPFWWPLAKQAAAAFAWPVVYDCMDHHAGFTTNGPVMLDQERELLSQANLVIASSANLETAARQHNRNVLLLRNACDYEHFAKVPGKSRGPRPVIGYFGAIADWFDADLVADLAERRPDWDFILVGSTFSADVSRLSKLRNVSLPGEKPYAEIPDWLAKFDLTILPFKRTPLTEATNPVKAYEIFAAGKPLISVPLPEMIPLTPMVRLASTAEEFEIAIEAELSMPDPALADCRRRFARDNTWQGRFEALGPAIRIVFPKATIVIVTFNNLELNQLCLQSVQERTEWPNFEVIVVDNASTDATADYLKQASLTWPDLRIILNDRNTGFAVANNLGLRQATGEYLVLLNNDTVVPRGWLSSLIRHLSADASVGMIGPVTNEIGNEAKVPVTYEKLADMTAWAARFMRENDSQVIYPRMLAMFCVAMRRQTFQEVGFLDERYEVGMFEDDDYSRRLKEKGYRLVCARDSFVHHVGQASFKLLSTDQYQAIFEKNRRVYEQAWGEMWEPPIDEKDRQRIPGLRLRLQEIVAQSGCDGDHIVVFLPSVGWNLALVQRPHHLARELARKGFVVFFDCAGSLVDQFADFVPVENNLWLYKGPAGVLDTLSQPILWTLPYNVPLVDRWAKRTIIYDWIDDLSVFPYNQARLRKNHERMLSEADTVMYVARALGRKLDGRRGDALYVPNATDYERFASPTGQTALAPQFWALIANDRPTAIYYGAIASWLDVPLLATVAKLRADWNFVLIGQTLPDAPSLQELEGLSNFLVLPAQKYECLPDYLAHCVVALIPFRVNEITLATSPLKLYEYFAAGIPVISTPMPECQAYPEVQIVRDAGEFAPALDMARDKLHDHQFRERLRALARANTWGARVATVVERLRPRAARLG